MNLAGLIDVVLADPSLGKVVEAVPGTLDLTAPQGLRPFVLGALVGGRLLAIELTAYPLARRGIVSRSERIAALRPLRTRTVVFGACVFLTFLLPLGAVVAMPAAMVGATMLARQVTSPSDSGRPGLPGLRLEGGTHRIDRGVDE